MKPPSSSRSRSKSRPPLARRRGRRPPTRKRSARGTDTSPRAAESTDRARRAPTPRHLSARPISGGSRPSTLAAVASSTRTCPGSVASRAEPPGRGLSAVAPGEWLRLPRDRRRPASRAGSRARVRRRSRPGPTRTPQHRPVVGGCDAVAAVRERPRPPTLPRRRQHERDRAPSGGLRPTSGAVSRRRRTPTSRRCGSMARFARTIRSSAGIRSRSIAPQLGAPSGGRPVSNVSAVAANE